MRRLEELLEICGVDQLTAHQVDRQELPVVQVAFDCSWSGTVGTLVLCVDGAAGFLPAGSTEKARAGIDLEHVRMWPVAGLTFHYFWSIDEFASPRNVSEVDLFRHSRTKGR